MRVCPATEPPRRPGSAPSDCRGLGGDTAAVPAAVFWLQNLVSFSRRIGKVSTRGDGQDEFTALLFVGQDLVTGRQAVSWLGSFAILWGGASAPCKGVQNTPSGQ